MKMLPEWKPQYSVNHTELDAQHKELFRLAAKVYSLDANAATKERISKLMKAFYEYIKKHFSQEEEYMELINYPKLDKHRAMHQGIITSLNSIIQQSQSLKEIRISMRKIVQLWLVEHILKHDMQYEKWRKDERHKNIQETTYKEYQDL